MVFQNILENTLQLQLSFDSYLSLVSIDYEIEVQVITDGFWDVWFFRKNYPSGEKKREGNEFDDVIARMKHFLFFMHFDRPWIYLIFFKSCDRNFLQSAEKLSCIPISNTGQSRGGNVGVARPQAP